jgi:hypothetical protein
MSRSLVAEENPRVVSENATREEVDIDHVAINIPIGHEEAANTIKAFTGNTILLSTKRGRHWHREGWNFLVLCWNPVIILTMLTDDLKGRMCNFMSARGHVVLPSGNEATHLIRGSEKPVPTMVFLAALIDSGVQFIRIIAFGMKQKLDTFYPIPRDLLLNRATDHGFPPNEWDVSISRRTQSLYLIKPSPPYPHDITINPYPILTPLNPNPRVSLGGNLSIIVEGGEEVLRLKMYNLQFHLLRAYDSEPLPTPINSRQGARSFDHLNSIFSAMEARPDLVGGLRMEIRVRFNHFLDAVSHVIENHLFSPVAFNVRTTYKTITVAEYVIYARGLFRIARRILTANGVMRHDVARELTNREKGIFGTLKLLLGFRHAGYRTDSRAANVWWLRPLPPAPVRQPNFPLAPPHEDQLINISDSDEEEQPPPQQQPPARPAPPPDNVNNELIILARNNRAPRGNRNVSWVEVHRLFHIIHPEINSTADQLRNRVRNLQQRNPDLLE